MFTLVWMLMVLQLRHMTTGYIETVTASGCESCRLYLTCRHLEAVIVILDFEFLPKNLDEDVQQNGTVFRNYTLTNFSALHPREVLNHRCSGVNHCSFILTEDCPGTSNWGLGTITIKYACVTGDKIGKYCNTNIRLPKEESSPEGISQGFLINPGYPRFYAGQRKCTWKITAPPQQRLKITLLDISLIVDNVADPEDCTDVLTISDTGQVIFSTCRQENPPTEVVSGSESVEVVLSASRRFNPALRGVLLKYAAVGCATPPTPPGARLLRRDDSVVEFACGDGAVFPDTGAATRVVRCRGRADWNETLPLLGCVRGYKSQQSDIIHQYKVPEKTAQMASELIAPTIIMVSLFIINAAIVFFINKARKRQALLIVNDEELATFRSSQENQPK